MRTFIETDHHNLFYVAEFKASELKTVKQFIHACWQAFNIPFTETNSLDALHDAMTDLSWLEQPNIKVIIHHYHGLNKKGYQLQFIEQNLADYQSYWQTQGRLFVIELN